VNGDTCSSSHWLQTLRIYSQPHRLGLMFHIVQPCHTAVRTTVILDGHAFQLPTGRPLSLNDVCAQDLQLEALPVELEDKVRADHVLQTYWSGMDQSEGSAYRQGAVQFSKALLCRSGS
jgi:hypothetical protein